MEACGHRPEGPNLRRELIEHDVPVHFVATHGDYMEIDTEEDYALAKRDWPARVSESS